MSMDFKMLAISYQRPWSFPLALKAPKQIASENVVCLSRLLQNIA